MSRAEELQKKLDEANELAKINPDVGQNHLYNVLVEILCEPTLPDHNRYKAYRILFWGGEAKDPGGRMADLPKKYVDQFMQNIKKAAKELKLEFSQDILIQLTLWEMGLFQKKLKPSEISSGVKAAFNQGTPGAPKYMGNLFKQEETEQLADLTAPNEPEYNGDVPPTDAA